MINIFVLVTILGHLPVILSAKSKGSEDMKQILIVEDDSFLNKMLAYNLTADGYGVTSTLNARTAAEAIRQREFDLVLLDINLPDGNGFELCKLIKPQHPDTIVIFLTANDQESDQIRGYEVGAVDYITKPFVIGALQRKIKAMFAMLEHHKLTVIYGEVHAVKGAGDIRLCAVILFQINRLQNAHTQNSFQGFLPVDKVIVKPKCPRNVTAAKKFH